MSGILAGVAAVAALGTPGFFNAGQDDRNLAVPPPYVHDRATNWVVVPEVGRSWLPGNLVVGGAPAPAPLAWGDPGPTAYGASQYDFRGVPVRILNGQFAISPWVRVDGNGSLQTTERARQTWLRENGFTGGTRVFHGLGLSESAGDQASVDEIMGEDGLHRIRIRVNRPTFEVRLPEDATIVTASTAPRTIVSAPKADTTEIASRD